MGAGFILTNNPSPGRDSYEMGKTDPKSNVIQENCHEEKYGIIRTIQPDQLIQKHDLTFGKCPKITIYFSTARDILKYCEGSTSKSTGMSCKFQLKLPHWKKFFNFRELW